MKKGNGLALTTHETRSRNLAAVFEAIRDGREVSRSEIAPAMPFSLQTMTNVTQELLTMGLVEEGERIGTGLRGKPQVKLHIRPGCGYSIGMQIRWNSVTLVLVDLSFVAVDQVVVPIKRSHPREYFEELLEAIRSFRERHKGRSIWALGVSSPLSVGTDMDPALFARRFAWGDKIWFETFWQAFTADTLLDALSQEVELPVMVLNNPQSAAIAESLHMPSTARFVYIMLGLSLGAAFINARQLNHDLWRDAGEVGYIYYNGDTLNRFLSVSGLREALSMPEPQGVYEPILQHALQENGPVVRQWFEQASDRLRLLINFIENAMRPDGIVLGGFIENPYLHRLLEQTEPLTNSVVKPSGDASRILPRIAVARESALSIPVGAAICTLNSQTNPNFPDLLKARRST